MSGGQQPVKTSLPQQVWMYAEGSTGMENEELLLSDLPGLRPTLNFPVLQALESLFQRGHDEQSVTSQTHSQLIQRLS